MSERDREGPAAELFRRLRAERASGRLTTVRDWLERNPPDPSAFTQTLAGVARRTRSGEPFFHAVREFLDEMSVRPPELRQQAIDDPPEPAGDPRFDAYLGALAEHLTAVHGLRRPSWSCEPSRFLDSFWFPSAVPGFRATAIAQSPAAFRRRGVFIAAGALDRC